MDTGDGGGDMSLLCWFLVCKKKKKKRAGGTFQESVGKSCELRMTTFPFLCRPY